MQSGALKRILLPIDISRCPLEAFEVANGFGKHPGMTLVLVHVLRLNIAAPENRIYEELAQEAHWYLEQLAEQYLRWTGTLLIHIRAGRPAEEILKEAQSEEVDLIILPTYGPSLWRRLTGIWKTAADPIISGLAAIVLRRANCHVCMVTAKSRFNCEEAWGRLTNNAYPDRAAEEDWQPRHGNGKPIGMEV